jgi:hypothetical protein
VKSGAHYTVVAETRVLYFASEDGLRKLVADGTHYWMDPTLNDLEQRLDAARFFRISRAALVSLGAIAEVHPMPGGSGEVRLKNGERLEVPAEISGTAGGTREIISAGRTPSGDRSRSASVAPLASEQMKACPDKQIHCARPIRECRERLGALPSE